MNRAEWFIMLAFLCYSALFILRTSFTVDGERYFCLFDDAMISMRYAKHLASGFGLTWNLAGARVEGYTNPLWVVYMAVLHLLPLSPAKISVLVQSTGGVLLALNLLVVKKITDSFGTDSTVSSIAMLFTAFYLPLNNWALQGMEVGLLALLVSFAVLRTLRWMEIGSARVDMLLLSLFFLMTLVRIDMFVPAAGMVIYLGIVKRDTKMAIAISSVLLLSLILQSWFRFYYFGNFLPNTYYLKVTGFPAIYRVSKGLYVFIKFVIYMGVIPFLFPFIAALSNANKKRMLLVWVFLVQVLYSVHVGGDAWENWGGANRYLCVAMPCFFVLVALGFTDLARLKFVSRWSLREVRTGYALAVLVCLVAFNALSGFRSLRQLVLIDRPLHVITNQDMVQRARDLAEVTSPNAKVAVVLAGVVPYFAERNYIDMLGKMDPYIAHLPMRDVLNLPIYLAFYPGHMKFDYSYSIGQLHPDVVVDLWRHKEEASTYLADYLPVMIGTTKLYLLKESRNVLWERTTRTGCLFTHDPPRYRPVKESLPYCATN